MSEPAEKQKKFSPNKISFDCIETGKFEIISCQIKKKIDYVLSTIVVFKKLGLDFKETTSS